MSGAVRCICINSEILDLIQNIIKRLYLKRLSGRGVNVISDLVISRERTGMLCADEIRVLHDIAAGGLLSRCHNRNRICCKQ